jgi:hypothetical protein
MRERALKVVLVLVGLLFVAAAYPVAMDLWHGDVSDSGDTMMMSLYLTLGIFLLLAVRHPSAHRSLIAFAAWSSFAHAVVMSGLAFQHQFASERAGFLGRLCRTRCHWRSPDRAGSRKAASRTGVGSGRAVCALTLPREFKRRGRAIVYPEKKVRPRLR